MPWVETPRTNREVNSLTRPSAWKRRSSASSPARCPPFSSQADAEARHQLRARRRASPRSCCTGRPSRTAASSRFGVTNVRPAKKALPVKIDRVLAAAAAHRWSRPSRDPPPAAGVYPVQLFANGRGDLRGIEHAGLDRRPRGRPRAKGGFAPRTTAGGMGWIALTFPGTSATTQVTAVSPYTPSAVKVLRSAWMPAPALLSEPAMVRATGGVFGHGVKFAAGVRSGQPIRTVYVQGR